MWNFNSSSAQKTDGSLMTLRTQRWVRKSRKHHGKTKSFCSTSYVSPDWFSVLKITLNTSELSLKPGKSSQQTKHQIQNKQTKIFLYTAFRDWKTGIPLHRAFTVRSRQPWNDLLSADTGITKAWNTHKEPEEPQALTVRVRLLGVWLRFWVRWVGWRSAICERGQLNLWALWGQESKTCVCTCGC